MTDLIPENMTEKEKIVSILTALRLPEKQWCVFGSSVMLLHDLERSKELGDIDIFVSTALWFAMYESTELVWGLAVPDPESDKRRNDPPYLYTELLGIPVNVFSAWRRRSIGDIDVNLYMNNTDTVEGFPCIPLQFLLDYKRELGRAKDVADVAVLKKHLGERAL